MVDFLLHATVNNLIVSACLALIAWTVQKRIRSASLANLLWALVLVKLVTPPIFCMPLLELPRVAQVDAGPAIVSEFGSPEHLIRQVDHEATLGPAVPLPVAPSEPTGKQVVNFASIVWIATSLTLLVVSSWRIACFHRSLRANSREDRGRLRQLATTEARRIGLSICPPVVVTVANIAPFVWWMRGRPVVVIPERATQSLDENDLRFVISHELAHIKRRDHWFRWLEWLAIVFFWWNPIMWLARQQLRIAEEMACDDLVLRAKPEANLYANSLLNMAELLAARAVRPPVLASAVNSGGSLERRLEMILSKRSWSVSPLMRMAIVAVAICVFPLGFVYAQEIQSLERRLGGAVEAGELTLDEAQLMLKTLRQSRESNGGGKNAWIENVQQLWVDKAGQVYEWRADNEFTEERDLDDEDEVDRQEHADSDDEDEYVDEAKHNTWRHIFVPDGGKVLYDDASSNEGALRFHQLVAALKAAIKKGDVSKEQAAQQLQSLHQMLIHRELRGGSDDSEGAGRYLLYLDSPHAETTRSPEDEEPHDGHSHDDHSHDDHAHDDHAHDDHAHEGHDGLEAFTFEPEEGEEDEGARPNLFWLKRYERARRPDQSMRKHPRIEKRPQGWYFLGEDGFFHGFRAEEREHEEAAHEEAETRENTWRHEREEMEREPERDEQANHFTPQQAISFFLGGSLCSAFSNSLTSPLRGLHGSRSGVPFGDETTAKTTSLRMDQSAKATVDIYKGEHLRAERRLTRIS